MGYTNKMWLIDWLTIYSEELKMALAKKETRRATLVQEQVLPVKNKAVAYF